MTRIEAAMHLDGCHFFVWVAQDGQLTFDERQGDDLYLHSQADCPRCIALKRGATPQHQRRKIELPAEPKAAFMAVLVGISDIPGVSDESDGAGEESRTSLPVAPDGSETSNQDRDPAISPCPTCDGVGAQAGAHTERVEPCPSCDGSGRKKVGATG